MTTKPPHVLYHFKADDPQSDKPMKLSEWIAWRQAEDERLERMRNAAHEAFFEGMAAQFERDVNGLTNH